MQDASSVLTGKLYDDDAYAKAFEAVIVERNGVEVILDQTLFFPEEGGQSSDHGMLGGYPVEEVRIKDGVIRHRLCVPEAEMEAFAARFAEGETVHGEIDWAERFSNMQQHSGEHIFSGIVNSRFGFNNVGFHLSAREVTLDFDGVLTPEDLRAVETEANRVIQSNIETEIRHTTREERESIAYRSKLDLEGDVRLVIFPGVDICACCAPHVRRTGEIGLLKIVSAINYKGGVRVSILCGMRALSLFASDHERLGAIAGAFSTSAEEVYGRVMKMKDDLYAAKTALHNVSMKMLRSEIAALPEDAVNVCLIKEGLEAEDVRGACNTMVEAHEGICAVFNGSEESGYAFVIGSRSRDCREVMKLLKEKFGARGGGKPEMVQGSLKGSESALREMMESL